MTDPTDVTLFSPSDAERARGEENDAENLMGEKAAGASRTVTPVTWIDQHRRRRSELLALSDALRQALGRSVIRRERVWPQLGQHALVLSRRDGEPWRDRPGVITDRRGGNLRIGPDGKPRPPALVEYRVDGYVNWYPWFCLRVVDREEL